MSQPLTGRRLVIFGAGAVGRGFIGELFADAGWTVSFLDVDAGLIDLLNRDGSYLHRTVGGVSTTRRVAPVVAGRSTDADHVLAEVAAADCIATSVGARVLPLIAPVLRDALLARFRGGGEAVDVLLCENLHGAASVMHDLLVAGQATRDASVLVARTGLVETSIGRMIPVPVATGVITSDIAVEPYRFLPVDAAALRTPVLRSVPGLVLDDSIDFSFYTDRKLYVHNLGHFLCGLLGAERGHEFVWQAVADPAVRYFTRAAMLESATALAADYGRPVPPLTEHVDDLLHRFANKALGDPIARVVRDPLRKLEPGDRVLGAYRRAADSGLPSSHLSLALAAGTLAVERVADADGASSDDRLRAATEGLPDGSLDLAREQLAALRRGFDFSAQLALIGRRFDPPHIP